MPAALLVLKPTRGSAMLVSDLFEGRARYLFAAGTCLRVALADNKATSPKLTLLVADVNSMRASCASRPMVLPWSSARVQAVADIRQHVTGMLANVCGACGDERKDGQEAVVHAWAFSV